MTDGLAAERSTVLCEVVERFTNPRFAPGTQPALDLDTLGHQDGDGLIGNLKRAEDTFISIERPSNHSRLEQLCCPTGSRRQRRTPTNRNDVYFTDVILGYELDYGQLP